MFWAETICVLSRYTEKYISIFHSNLIVLLQKIVSCVLSLFIYLYYCSLKLKIFEEFWTQQCISKLFAEGCHNTLTWHCLGNAIYFSKKLRTCFTYYYAYFPLPCFYIVQIEKRKTVIFLFDMSRNKISYYQWNLFLYLLNWILTA